MRGSSGFLHAPFVRVGPVLILRRWSANAAWKARVSNLERAQAWMPERMPGGAALGSPEPTTMRVLARPPRCCRLRGGSCLVARLFRRRLLWWRWHRHGGEKLERSSSTRRPLRLLGGQAWCSSLLAARRLAQRVSLRSSVERSIPRMLAALVLLPLAASMVARM